MGEGGLKSKIGQKSVTFYLNVPYINGRFGIWSFKVADKIDQWKHKIAPTVLSTKNNARFSSMQTFIIMQNIFFLNCAK